MDKDSLQQLIQDKKESQDYYTIREGLITEMQCFEAVEALGHRKFVLKDEIDKRIKSGCDPKTDQQMQGLVIAMQKIHQMQSQVVKDICDRFEVIHPQYENPSAELLSLKQPYWDWYRSMYKKYYGRPAPEIVDAKSE